MGENRDVLQHKPSGADNLWGRLCQEGKKKKNHRKKTVNSLCFDIPVLLLGCCTC